MIAFGSRPKIHLFAVQFVVNYTLYSQNPETALKLSFVSYITCEFSPNSHG